jgi:protein transport protein SEC20
MGSTYSEYQNFGSLLNLSKSIITKLEASDWLDRILLLFGLFIFLSVVIYIIKKRTWDVGISWATWFMGKGGKKAANGAAKAATTAIIQHTATIEPTATVIASSIVESSSTIGNSMVESSSIAIDSSIIESSRTIISSTLEAFATNVKDEL